ncbi:MAG: type II toxin-antitoxin system RelE/ParE family toxin [Campylobacterota bacterium]|nr:type II toxin-antitoxin system RelE/ParE family toxin [Campylobacterota bacterium]
MIIIKDENYLSQLFTILSHIRRDKQSVPKKFEKELNDKISLLKTTPYMCRQSIYFDNKDYRDLIYSGYTIIYKIEEEKILILEIFKWQNR